MLLSKRAHESVITADTRKIEQVENRIDETVAFNLYGLNEKELSSLRETLELLR